MTARVRSAELVAVEIYDGRTRLGTVVEQRNGQYEAAVAEGRSLGLYTSCRDYVLEPHHIRLLTLAGEAFDRCGQARALIASEGLSITTESGGAKAHPAVAIERDSRLAFARLLRELDLDVEPPSDTRAGPLSLRSNSRR